MKIMQTTYSIISRVRKVDSWKYLVSLLLFVAASMVSRAQDTPPKLIRASVNCSGGLLDLEFDKQLDSQVANDASHYTLDGGITVLSALTRPNLEHVALTTSAPLTQSQAYTVTVNGVTDLLGNPIAPNSQITFQCDPTAPQLVSAAANCSGGAITVNFDKQMTDSALNPANYALS